MQNLLKNWYLICSRTAVRLVDRAKMTEHTFMIIVAIIIGVFAGFGAITIRSLIKLISDFAFAGQGNLLENIIGSPWFLVIWFLSSGGYWSAP